MAGVALILSVIGAYGVIHQSVAARTQEIGIRMALGANAAAVRRRVLTGGLAPAVAGLALGLLGSLALSRTISTFRRMFLNRPSGPGYTMGMKTAVSIPDEVFEKVERLARRAGRSRSAVFSAALREYVARHAPDEVTDAMDRVCAQLADQQDGFVTAAGRRVLENTEW